MDKLKLMKRKSSRDKDDEDDDEFGDFEELDHMLTNTRFLVEYEFFQVLGQGSFGTVHLVKAKTRSKVFFSALKVMDKKVYIDSKHVEKADRERALLMEARSCKYITKLFDALQFQNKFCLELEFINGSDLWTVQNNRPDKKTVCFTTKQTRYILGQVFLALKFLHERDIIYRDLKTENILVDYKWRVKLTDFGFAKKLEGDKRTATLCGTPDYMAPEILLHKWYTFAIDWWSFGILVYELVAGQTPFAEHEVDSKKYRAIVEDRVKYPSFFKSNLISLLEGLLKKSPSERLGHMKLRSMDIYNHYWWSNVWYDLENNKNSLYYTSKLPSVLKVKAVEAFPELPKGLFEDRSARLSQEEFEAFASFRCVDTHSDYYKNKDKNNALKKITMQIGQLNTHEGDEENRSKLRKITDKGNNEPDLMEVM
ncbi:hypothetical protein Ciccas_009404 [Cichlidogyrus casuarinus]|uniref:Protein kinase domain-containing protein n=1 Tax=Cichlidogyrus casuarinus TaxID=1844966 RepID=A0ABD2PYJ3_9PLAT